MIDMYALERQLADESHRIVGPARPVDDHAIFEAAVDAVRSPRWRFPSMFNATSFVVAGAIVALFGGFLMAGVLTQPREAVAPAAVGGPGPAPLITGHWVGQGTCPSEGVSRSTVEVVDGVSQSRGYVCHLEADWSDTRLQGTITYYSSSDGYWGEQNPDGPDVGLESYVIHIENDEGGWWMGPVHGVYCKSSCHADSGRTPSFVPIVFEGEGAYEGLIFVGTASDDEIRGFILEGALPPSPDTSATG